MNTASNLLPVTPSAAPASSNKAISGKPQSQSKSSFGDTLSSAVAQEDEAIVQEPVAMANPLQLLGFSVPSSLLQQPLIAAEEQIPSDNNPMAKDTGLLDNLSQDVLSNPNNAALAAQVLITMGSANLLSDTAASSKALTSTAGQPIAAANAGMVTQPQMALPELSVSDQFKTALTLESLTQPGQQGAVTKQPPLVQEKAAEPGKIANTVANTNFNGIEQGDLVTASKMFNQLPVAQSVVVAAQPQTTVATRGQGTDEVTNQLQEQQTTQPEIAMIPVNASRQDAGIDSSLNGEGNKDSLLDESVNLTNTTVVSDGNETINSPIFAQNLDKAVLSISTGVPSAAGIESQQQPSPYTDVHQIIDQVVEQTKVIAKPHNTEMVMKLKPEHLGELTLKVAVENGVVNASFHSNNAEVRTLIEASLPQLKQDLANNGLKVDNVSVYAGLSQFQPNHDQDRNSRQQLMKFTNKKSADDFVEAIDGELTEGTSLGVSSQLGVDYRI